MSAQQQTVVERAKKHLASPEIGVDKESCDCSSCAFARAVIDQQARIERLEKALRRLIPKARDAKHEHYSDLAGNEDTRTEAIAAAFAVLSEGA